MIVFWVVFGGLVLLDSFGNPSAQEQQSEPAYVCSAKPYEWRERAYVCRAEQHDSNDDDERERERADDEPLNHRGP